MKNELRFRKNKAAALGLVLVVGLFIVAVVADFIASDKPLVMNFQGQIYSPVLKDYAVWLHLSRWQRQFQNISYKEFAAANFKDGDWVWFPPIRYSPNDYSLKDTLQPP